MFKRLFITMLLGAAIVLSGCAHTTPESDMLSQIAEARGWTLTPSHDQVFIEGVRLGKSLVSCDGRTVSPSTSGFKDSSGLPVQHERPSLDSAVQDRSEEYPANKEIRHAHADQPVASAPPDRHAASDRQPVAQAFTNLTPKAAPEDDTGAKSQSSASAPRLSTGKGLLRDLFPDAVFKGNTAGLMLDRDIPFISLAELASALQSHLSVFVEATDNGLVFSDLKEVVYQTGFVTEELAADIKSVLSHTDSRISVNRAARTITLLDNLQGHRNISMEIASRQKKYRPYTYKVELFDAGKSISSAVGAVSGAFPVQFAPDGGVSLSLAGDKVLITAIYPKYPDRLQGIIETKGGVVEAQRDSMKLRITLSASRD